MHVLHKQLAAKARQLNHELGRIEPIRKMLVEQAELANAVGQTLRRHIEMVNNSPALVYERHKASLETALKYRREARPVAL